MVFCDEVTGSVVGGVVAVTYLSFSKTFEILFCRFSMEKQMKYVLDRWTERWVDPWAEGLVVNGSKSNWQFVRTGWRAGQVFRKNILNRVRPIDQSPAWEPHEP